jgi:hypothetical protein
MAKVDLVEQLRTLNEVLARTSASDPERAEHARRALEFYNLEQGSSEWQPCIRECADTLVRLHLGEQDHPDLAFAHWHVPTLEDFSPLWIRQAIVVEMKKLAGRRQSLLLVTGLRESVCPEGCYWTYKRQLQFNCVRTWVEDLACAWISRGSQLQLVII